MGNMGLGGERLNARELNKIVEAYLRKAEVSFSNKVSTLRGANILVRNTSNTIYLLFERIKRQIYNVGGIEVTGAFIDNAGGLIADDISDITLLKTNDGLSAAHTITNIDTNRSDPFLLEKRAWGDDGYDEYTYTYTMLTLEITSGQEDVNSYYKITDILDSLGASIVFEPVESFTGFYYETGTTLRISQGRSTLVPETPICSQNKSIPINITEVLDYAFENRTSLIINDNVLTKTNHQIELGQAFSNEEVETILIKYISDVSGLSVTDSDGVNIVSSAVTILASGKYLHSVICEYYDYFENDVQVYGIVNILDSKVSGITVLLPNTKYELSGLNYPLSLKTLPSGTPLTNTLLSFMDSVLSFTIYKYGIQNYTSFNSSILSDVTTKFKNNSTFGLDRFMINNHLIIAAAYYQLADLATFDDGLNLAWDVMQNN